VRNPARTFFFHFLVSYLAVITINIAAYAVVYVRSARTVAAQAEETIMLQLQRGGDIVSARLEEIESSAYRIASDPDIVGFSRVRAPINDRDYYSLLSIGSGFVRYGMKNSFVDSVYLIFRNSGAVFSTYYASPSFEWIYSHFFRYNGMGYDEWEISIDLWSARKGLYPVSEIEMYGKTVQGLTHRVPMAMGGRDPKATLLAVIARESIIAYFAELTEHESSLEIHGADGELLFSAGPPDDEAQRGIRVSVQSGASELTFSAFVPNSYVAGRMQLFRGMFITVVIATLLAATLAASLFAFRTSRPFARLFGMMVRAGGVDPEHAHPDTAFLVESMEQFLGERVDVERGIQRRKQLLRSGFYERLLRGGFLDEDEVHEHLDSLGMTLPRPPWVVAVVVSPETTSDSPHPVSEVLIHDYLENRKPEAWHLHKTGEGDVLLLPGGPENVDAASGLLRRLFVNLGLVTVVATGNARNQVLELTDSFTEALLALRSSFWDASDHQVVRYRSEDDGDEAVYDERKEQQIVSLALSGDVARLRSLVEEIRSDVLTRQHRSTTTIEKLFIRLTSAAAKMLSTVRLEGLGLPENPVRYLQRYASAGDFFKRYVTIVEPVCRDFSRVKKGHSELQLERIHAHVRAHHTDPMLSLASTAEHFGLNHQYLSRFFREHAEQSFSSFLEKLRMDSAKQVMGSTTLSLREVAANSGYLSWNSFYKAFKRFHGVSPGRYREMMLSGEG
jgi:two-component system, response regulator YesN